MTNIPSLLNYENTINLVPVIKKFLEKFDNTNFEIEVQTFNDQHNWIIFDPLERYQTDFTRFITFYLHKLNDYPGFTLGGDNPLDCYIYSQLNQETVIFEGLLLVKKQIDIEGKKNDLINQNFKYIKGNPQLTSDLKKKWKITELYPTALGPVFISDYSPEVDYQIFYQEHFRNNKYLNNI